MVSIPLAKPLTMVMLLWARLVTISSVICLPSVNTTEGWGLVLAEGALYGCIPVASDLLGVRENISLLKGFIFHTGSYEDLAQIIKMLMSNSEKYLNYSKTVSQAARKYSETYSIDKYVDEHEKLFRKIVLASKR